MIVTLGQKVHHENHPTVPRHTCPSNAQSSAHEPAGLIDARELICHPGSGIYGRMQKGLDRPRYLNLTITAPLGHTVSRLQPSDSAVTSQACHLQALALSGPSLS